MKKRFFVKTTAFLLQFFILLSIAAPAATAVSAEDKSEPIVVLAGSDFQAKNTDGNDDYHINSSANVRSIISAVKADGINSVDGFLFAGDYHFKILGNNTTGVAALKNTMQEEYPTLEEENMVFVQGNHDYPSTVGLSNSGDNDTDDYGVFVINEDDYMWKDGHDKVPEDPEDPEDPEYLAALAAFQEDFEEKRQTSNRCIAGQLSE